MNAKEFIAQFGEDEAKRVAAAAGTNWDYLRQIASGSRRPSPELAARLVTASGDRLDFACLLRPKTGLAV